MKALSSTAATSTNSPYNTTTHTIYVRPPLTTATRLPSLRFEDDGDWWRSVHGIFDESAYAQHLWKKAREERLAVEQRLAKAAAREGTRERVRAHARPQREPEKRAAVSVRMFAQRVR